MIVNHSGIVSSRSSPGGDLKTDRNSRKRTCSHQYHPAAIFHIRHILLRQPIRNPDCIRPGSFTSMKHPIIPFVGNMIDTACKRHHKPHMFSRTRSPYPAQRPPRQAHKGFPFFTQIPLRFRCPGRCYYHPSRAMLIFFHTFFPDPDSDTCQRFLPHGSDTDAGTWIIDY